MHDVGFRETNQNPDYVVIGESDSYSHDSICKAIELVHRGARLIATNPDVADPVENGSIAPSTGSWVSVIEAATGKRAYFPGKPNPIMMRSALTRLHLHSSDAVMIGDRMDTDIVSGIESNLKTILVLSGISTVDVLDNYPYRPFLVLDNVGCIPPPSFP
jgi:NagD protein